MKVYFATDHGGFEAKNKLVAYVAELGYEVEDCGAHEFDAADDYPAIIASAAEKIWNDVMNGIESRGIIMGGSGQGEAMVANRFKGVRAAVYYGPAQRPQTDASGHTIDIITSIRMHNDANVLSLGGRFLTEDEIKEAVKTWLSLPFSGEERHARRIRSIDAVN